MGVAIAGVATWTVLHAGGYSARRLCRQLGAVLVADLTLFNLFVVNPPITEAAAQAHTTLADQVATATGEGRFIIYDPDRFEFPQLYAMGQVDLNLYRSLPSAQGYTALTDGGYYDATGAHCQETLDPSTLAGPVWDRLNVTALLSLPGYFVTPLPPSASSDESSPNPNTVPPANRVSFGANPTQHTSTLLGAPTQTTLTPGAARPWYFGGRLTLERLTVPVDGGMPSGLQAGLLSLHGTTRWLPAGSTRVVRTGSGHSVEVTLGHPEAVGGIVLRLHRGPGDGGHPHRPDR